MTVKGVTIAVPRSLCTVPVAYGIEHADWLHARLLSCPEAECAELFSSSQADVALLPVGRLLNLKDADIVFSYCLGGNCMHRSVLASSVPVEQVRLMWYTGQSLTERYFTAVMAAKKWGAVKFELTGQLPPVESLSEGQACILSGDGAWQTAGAAPYRYDIGQLWQQIARQPMVHAVWVARRSVDNHTLDALQQALTFGMEHTWEAVCEHVQQDPGQAYLALTQSVDYIFDNQKHRALGKFWDSGLKTTLRINPG